MSPAPHANHDRTRRSRHAASSSARPARPLPDPGRQRSSDEGDAGGGLRGWHLLVSVTVLAVAASVVVTSGSSVVNIVSVAVAVATCALVAAALFRSLLPFSVAEVGEQAEMLGGRTRAALEREKMLVLRSIKELEFDRAMRKVSDGDFLDMASRLRARAAGLMRQLDGGGGYRELIEREVAARVSVMRGPFASREPASDADGVAPQPGRPPKAAPAFPCEACGIHNDPDARFCKSCGARLAGAV
jgi:hypothetical protein